MTEISDRNDALPPALEDFILQWGNFGAQWGVNRSVSQIQAFLYISEEPKTAEEISESLGLARSNVSNSLKELLAWKLIYRVPVKQDRKDHFIAETDLWKIAMQITAIRKEREIDTALAALKSCVAASQQDRDVSATQRKRLEAMLSFTQSAERWYTQMLSIPQSKRESLLKLGSKIASFLPSRG